MKKIYTLVMSFVLAAVAYNSASAQCDNGTAAPFNFIFSDGSTGCFVRIIGGTPGLKVSVYSDEGGLNLINANPSQAVFVGANGLAQVAIICGQPVKRVTLIGEDASTTPRTPIFEDITGTCIGPAQNIDLPIVLTSFTASIKSASTVVLNWSSSLESNSSHIDVEKSADGKNFTAIGTVKAAGNSVRNIDYSFADTKFSSTAFYRLKLVDLDGKYEYSKVVYVNNGTGGTTTLSVFPNPFKSEIQLKGVSASEVNKQNIKVFNVAGKEVGYRLNGSNSIMIDAGLPEGIYILRVKDQTYKMMKTK